VAIAFPEFPVYTKLLSRIIQALRLLGLIVLLVQKSGNVVVFLDEPKVIDSGGSA
jgi:hypothetical protein